MNSDIEYALIGALIGGVAQGVAQLATTKKWPKAKIYFAKVLAGAVAGSLAVSAIGVTLGETIRFFYIILAALPAGWVGVDYIEKFANNSDRQL